MASWGVIKLVLLVVIAAVAAAPHVEAITCSQVVADVSSCLAYLRGGGAVTPACCSGARSLNNAAATTPDRQTVCGCIKTVAPGIGAKPEFINSLPGKCGIKFPYTYSPSIDCSKIK